MQQLRDKLAVAERTAKAEAQLKVGFPVLRFPELCLSLLHTIFLLAYQLFYFSGKVPDSLQSFGGKA